MEALFRGAAAAAWRELGVVPEREVKGWSGDSAQAARRFATWRRRIARDPDVAEDARAMVPFSYDPLLKQTRVLAFLGWVRRADAQFSFYYRPRVTTAPLRFPGVRVVPQFVPRRCTLVEPVIVETYVSRLLDRDAFRSLCDRHRTREAIVRALGGRDEGAGPST